MEHQTPPIIDHWSYSAMMKLMRNPLAFKKTYVLKIYDDDNYSPAAIGGRGCHKAIEYYLKTFDVETAIAEGLKVVENTPDISIDYGKTGSREKMLKDYTAGVQMYFDECPDWKNRKIIFVEERMTETITDQDGEPLPLPAKCVVDVVWESTREEIFNGVTYPIGSLFIEDHKFIRSYSEANDDDPARLVQCMFNYHILYEKLGRKPDAMLYNEIKLSKNKDGSPQSQYYTVRFEDYPHYFTIFYKLYRDFTKYISQPDVVFLPNFTDMFDGKNSYETYAADLITVDVPVAVPKKTKQVDYIDKQYTPSAVDKPENKNLTNEEKIKAKLLEFGIPVEMGKTYSNSTISMYTLKPSRGVRMKSIEAHDKDLALALEASSVRIQAPIMGTNTVGVEVPNKKRSTLNFELNPAMLGTMSIPIGVDVYGKRVEKDLRDMPHVLFAGTTGSGKSSMLNVVIQSLTGQMEPENMKLVLIDPKRVEFSKYKDLPHLLTGVIHDHQKAMRALKWLVDEMEDRYSTLESCGARNITEYASQSEMPYIVCVVDEFADLMLETKAGFTEYEFCDEHLEMCGHTMIDPLKLFRTKTKLRKKEQLTKESIEDCRQCKAHVYPPAEELIVRLAQKARAVGIHLVLATQRPTVDVVTGLIKANMPTRIAFSVPAKVDSQTIIDRPGAEELTGKGDLLFLDPSTRELKRLQGYFA